MPPFDITDALAEALEYAQLIKFQENRAIMYYPLYDFTGEGW